jgi:hypothetical protein
VVFALFHLVLLLGILGWAVVSLLHGNVGRAALIVVCLTAYYFIVLHDQVKKEIARTRKKRS